jgi:hypothetical protein
MDCPAARAALDAALSELATALEDLADAMAATRKARRRLEAAMVAAGIAIGAVAAAVFRPDLLAAAIAACAAALTPATLAATSRSGMNKLSTLVNWRRSHAAPVRKLRFFPLNSELSWNLPHQQAAKTRITFKYSLERPLLTIGQASSLA